VFKKIKKIREARGLTQEQLSKMVNVSRPYLADIERGFKRNPSFALLERIAQALGVTVNDLLEEQKAG